MEKFRFIAMLDILGFKKLVERRSIDEIHDIMQDLFTASREGTSIDFQIQVNGVATPPHPIVRLNYFVFSDTILIWKDVTAEEEIVDDGENKQVVTVQGAERFNEFNQFCIGICRIFEEAILKKIPLRGAIAFGKSIINIDDQGGNNEIIGQPIVDAHLLGEAQKWVGVAFHSSCSTFIEEVDELRVKQYPNIPYDEERLARIAHGAQTEYTLQWGARVMDVLQEMKAELETQGASEEIIQKYRDTLEFCQNHEAFAV